MSREPPQNHSQDSREKLPQVGADCHRFPLRARRTPRAALALLRRALAAFAFAVRFAVFAFDFSRAAFRFARRFASASGLCFRLKQSIR